MLQPIKEFLKLLIPPLIIFLYRKIKVLTQLNEANSVEISPLQKEFRRLNKDLPTDEIMLRPGLMLKTHPSSRLAFEYFCYRSTEMAQELDAFIKCSRGKSRFMDIGALHGLFGLVFLSQDKKAEVLAFDPSPIAFQRLLYNRFKNEFDNLRAFEIALSDEEGELSMSYVWEHLVSNPDPDDAVVQVPKKKGDEICHDLGFVPDLVKIDVEGHEWKVIQGLDKTISEHKPTIFLEVHPNEILREGDSIAAITEYFAVRGYSFYDLNQNLINPDSIGEDRVIISTQDL